MDARTARQAAESVAESARRLAGCVSRQPIRASRRDRSQFALSFAPIGEPASLRLLSSAARLGFEFEQVFDVAAAGSGFAAQITRYSYRILEPEGREILAYHWHPAGLSPVRRPHVHLSSRIAPLHLGRVQATVSLGEMHIPTGCISLADIIWLLVEEFGVEPRRPDWRAVLAGAGDEPFAVQRQTGAGS